MPHPVLKVGAIEIIPLSDAAGAFWALADEVHVPSAAAWDPYRLRFPDAFEGDNWYTRLTAHLIRTPDRTILVDTGIGPGPVDELAGQRGSLPQQLDALGLHPSDIDLVLLTHLHFDHVGWNLTHGAPTFPRARYLVHQAEWDATQALAQQYDLGFVKHSVTPLQAAGVVDFLIQATELAPGVMATPTPGHTAGHMSVWVQSAGETALIIADVIHHPALVTELDWYMGGEFDTELSLATRRSVIEQAEAARATILAGHLPGTGIGRIVREDGRGYWQPL